MEKKEKKLRVLYNCMTVSILIVFLFPIYWMFITSLKGSAEIFASIPSFFPKKIDLSGYTSQLFVRSSVPIIINFRNSFIIAGATTIVSTILAAFSAYGLARFQIKMNRYILLSILITQMIPTVLFLSPLFITFKKIGVLDTLIAPVIFTCLHSIPFCIITLRPYFLGIPKELEDAAIIDGCSRLGVFIKIMVPISYPGLIVSAAFTFLWGWGDLMGALTFIKTDRLYPLTVNMYKAITEYGIEWNSLMAFAVILTIPVLLIFIFLQKYLISGITSGAVKG